MNPRTQGFPQEHVTTGAFKKPRSGTSGGGRGLSGGSRTGLSSWCSHLIWNQASFPDPNCVFSVPQLNQAWPKPNHVLLPELNSSIIDQDARPRPVTTTGTSSVWVEWEGRTWSWESLVTWTNDNYLKQIKSRSAWWTTVFQVCVGFYFVGFSFKVCLTVS